MGDGSLRLARAAMRAASKTGIEIIIAPPGPFVALVASSKTVPVFSQSVGNEASGKSTGAFLPEAVKGAGGRGTLLNHSESPKPIGELKQIVPRLKGLSLEICICAATTTQALTMAPFGPEYLAIEPPELIGSGIPVSRAKPSLVSTTVQQVREAGFKGRVLCGAGIVTGDDVAKAVALGADGILVSSSVVMAADWEAKIVELSRSLK